MHVELLSSDAREPVSSSFSAPEEPYVFFSCSFSSSLLAIVWSFESVTLLSVSVSGLVTIHQALVIFWELGLVTTQL